MGGCVLVEVHRAVKPPVEQPLWRLLSFHARYHPDLSSLGRLNPVHAVHLELVRVVSTFFLNDGVFD
jgi:hypothetical protein